MIGLSFRPFYRPTYNFSTIARLVLICIAFAVPSMARAQSTIKLKEFNKLEANGNGRITYDIKLSESTYTLLKKNTPNTALFLRKMGLTHQNMVIDQIKGDWLDGESTLHIEFTAFGIARAVKDTTWELPLFDGVDTELLAVTEGTAILTQAFQIPGMGLATSTIRITLPVGAGDVKTLKSPSRLSYKLPLPPPGTGEPAADFEVEAKAQLMSSLAKAMSNRQFIALWTARSKFKNTGTQTLKDYRVRFRIAEYAPTWSAWQGTPTVVAGQTLVDTYFPVFDMEKLGKLSGQVIIAMELQYQYKRPDGKLVEESDTREITLLSRNQVYYSSLKPEECVDWSDRNNLMAVVLASFVTHEDTVIQQAAGRIAKWSGGANAAGSDDEALKFMKAVFLFMGENVAYQTPPSGETGKQFNQHVKYGRDVLKNKAGTCIDLAILYGSLCQAVGLEAVLYSVPGHCFPAVKLPGSGRIIPVESTMIGRATFEEANTSAIEKQIKLMDAGQKPFTRVEIANIQKLGAFPLDLPNVGEDPLEKWGIKMPAPKLDDQAPARPTEQQPVPQQPTAAEKNLVGRWKGITFVGNLKLTFVSTFNADGTFEGKIISENQAQTATQNSTGTWKLNKNHLSIESEKLGTVVRKINLNGDVLESDFAELGRSITFSRQK